MKILGVGFNYRPHADEAESLGLPPQEVTESPIIFHKGDAVLRENYPFFIPDIGCPIEYEAELVIRISRVGKCIAREFAHRYYDAVTIGLDLTARQLQRELMAQGRPWTEAKVFDGSAVVGQWVPLSELNYPAEPIPFSLRCDGELVQQGRSDEMIHSFDELITHVSRFQTLRQGDLIFTGTPAGVGPLAIGQTLEGYIGERKLLHLRIK